MRTSFLLGDWADLGSKFPKAREALVAIRDADVRALEGSNNPRLLFTEIAYINEYLPDDDATDALFKNFAKR